MADLTGLNATQLDALIQRAQQRKELLKKRFSPARVRSEVVKYVEAHGYTMAELFGREVGGGARTRRAAPVKKIAPKYRNPSNPQETWTGRGRAPRWLQAQLDKGRKREKFLIRD